MPHIKGMVNLVCHELPRNYLNLSLLCHFFHCPLLITWTKGLLGPPKFSFESAEVLADSLCIFLLSDYHSPQLWKSSLKLWPLLCLCSTFSLSLQPISHYLLARPTSLAHHLYLTIHINSHIVLADHRPQVFQGKPFFGLMVLVDSAYHLPISIFSSSF